MVCLACRSPSRHHLCPTCSRDLRPGGVRLVEGVTVRSLWSHDGAARSLVHRLKYEAIAEVVDVVVGCGGDGLLPPDVTALIPVPRTRWRSAKYGIDPALALCRGLSAVTGIPVKARLAPAMVGRVHAGRNRSDRRPPSFRSVGSPAERAALVDDVLTTGVTLATAIGCLRGEVSVGITATVRV